DPGSVPAPQLGEGRFSGVRGQRFGVCRTQARRGEDPRPDRRQACGAGKVLPREAADSLGRDQGATGGASADAASRPQDHAPLRCRVERPGPVRRAGLADPLRVAQTVALVRVLAVDPGSKRVGLAISDPTGTIAQPLATVEAGPPETLASRLGEIARQKEAGRIIVGLPRRMDGSYGPEAKSARDLADSLRKSSGLPVELVDERLTSVAAERSLIESGVRREKRRQTVDRVAAAILLQSHLDIKRRA